MTVDRIEPEPPPYSSTTISKDENEEVKIQMIATKTGDTVKKEAAPSSTPKRAKIFDAYLDDGGNFCPLTCGAISARRSALVLAYVYLALHFALIIKMHKPDVTPEQRGWMTMLVTGLNAIVMTLAFVGLWRKRTGLMIPYIWIHFAETSCLSGYSLGRFSILAIDVCWCLASGVGDPLEKFYDAKPVGFVICAVLTAVAHFFVAVFVRAALAINPRFLYAID